MSRLDHPKMIWYLKLVTNPIQCTFKMNWYWFSEIPFFLARSLPNQIWRKQANDDLANSRLWEFVCIFFRLSTESQSRPTTWRYWEQLFGCPGKIHDVRHSVLAIGGSLFNHFTFRREESLSTLLFLRCFFAICFSFKRGRGAVLSLQPLGQGIIQSVDGSMPKFKVVQSDCSHPKASPCLSIISPSLLFSIGKVARCLNLNYHHRKHCNTQRSEREKEKEVADFSS